MGYPPPPRRHGEDQKRYYYSNNPNRRQPGPYVKKSFPKPYNSGSSSNIATKNYSSQIISEEIPNKQSMNNHHNSNNNTDMASSSSTRSTSNSFRPDSQRPSRYNSIATTTNSKVAQPIRSPGSRYNPDTDTMTSYKPQVNTIPNPNQTSINGTNNKHDTESLHKSRFSKSTSNMNTTSRYNPTSQASSGIKSYYSSAKQGQIPSQPHLISAYTQYTPGRYRPRTMDSPVAESKYNYISANNTSQNLSHSNSTNNVSGYFNRSSKWRSNIGNYRSHSNLLTLDKGTAKKVDNTNINSSANNYGEEHDINSSNYSLRTPDRKNSTNAFIDIPHEKTPTSRYDIKSVTSENTTVDNVKNQLNYATDKDTKSVNESPKPKHTHSSSLIHSIAQTTKEVERQFLLEHKRIDISKQRMTKNTGNSRDEEVKIEKSEMNDIFNDKSITRPMLKTMWTSDSKIQESIVLPLENRMKKSKDPGNASNEVIAEKDTTNQSEMSELSEKSQDIDAITELDEKEKSLSVDESSKIEHVESTYEYLYNTKYLKTNQSDLKKYINTAVPLPSPITKIEACIFPMKKIDLQLWILKNQTRDKIIEKQKYLLEKPIKALADLGLSERNYLLYKQETRDQLLKSLCIIKSQTKLHYLEVVQNYMKLKESWEKGCVEFKQISDSLRKEELEYTAKIEQETKAIEQIHSAKEDDSSKASSSRRRNRADFVDDTEMENVLLQIDPEYKYHQAAASIPPLIQDPVKRHITCFYDVNNLVTNKDLWASRVLNDGNDTFTQHEHELFLDGYLMYPKRFGKISHYMGGIRKPEECVVHYYSTKNTVNYKALLVEKTRKRKLSMARRRKKKERENETDTEPSLVMGESMDSIVSTPTLDKKLSVEHNLTESSSSTNVAVPSIKKAIVEPATEMIQTKETQEPSSDETKPDGHTNVKKSTKTEGSTDNAVSNDENIVPSNAESTVSINMINNDDATTEEGREKETVNSESKISSSNVGVKKNEISEPVLDTDRINKRKFEDIEVSANNTADNKIATNSSEATVRQKEIPSNGTQEPNNTTEVPDGQNAENHEIRSDDTSQRKKHKYVSDHKTSYWSVKEAQVFPELLRQYGSQWSLISEHLSTKSTTMVRNYYQRNAAQNQWKGIVDEADFRRNKENTDQIQHTQFMIQSQEKSSIIPPISNGIPSQQKPAIGFFANNTTQQHRSIERNDLGNGNSLNSTPIQQPFADFGKEQFSNSPLNTLPPPRLPSIQFPNSNSGRNEAKSIMVPNGTNYDKMDSQSNKNMDRDSTNTINSKKPTLSNIFNVINTMERNGAAQALNQNQISNQSSMPSKTFSQNRTSVVGNSYGSPLIPSSMAPSSANGIGHSVINTNNQYYSQVPTAPIIESRTSSISALLNPMSSNLQGQPRQYGSTLPLPSATESNTRTAIGKPSNTAFYQKNFGLPSQNHGTSRLSATTSFAMGTNTNTSSSTTTSNLDRLASQVSRVPQMPANMPNFASDPLAALAAIASAPETLATISSSSGNTQTSSAAKNKTP